MTFVKIKSYEGESPCNRNNTTVTLLLFYFQRLVRKSRNHTSTKIVSLLCQHKFGSVRILPVQVQTIIKRFQNVNVKLRNPSLGSRGSRMNHLHE